VSCLLRGFPDRVGRRREPGGSRVQLASGAGAVLEGPGPGGTLLVAVQLEAGRPGERVEHRIRLAAGVEEDQLDPQGFDRHLVLSWDAAGEAVRAFEARRWLQLELDRRPVPTPREDPAVGALLAAEAARRGLRPGDGRLDALVSRIRLLHAVMPELELPEVPAWEALLPALCQGLRSFAELRELDAAAALLAGWTWAQRQELDRHAPTHLVLPSGASAPIAYGAEGPPVLAARLQQLFGLAETPRVCRGRVPLLLHLLAPNQRPVQVTSDLAGFWRTGWLAVRAELRGRYPRHDWPEDPLAAAPTDRARPRGGGGARTR
jgi:ATP-dependent helicase HrpB